MTITYDTLYRENFSATAHELAEKIVSLVAIVAKDGETVSSLHSSFYPSKSDWPYAYVNGFTTIASSLKTYAPPYGFGGIYVMPIVYPENVTKFESYMQEQYAADRDIPSTAAVHSFGFGISATNSTTGVRYHDVTGGVGHGAHRFLTPVTSFLDNYDVDSNLWNAYDDYELATKGIDAVINCLQAGNTSCQVMMEPDSTGSVPAALVVTPIFPRLDPTDVVGFVVTAFSWSVFLREGVAELANNLYMVIYTNGADPFTAKFQDGIVTMVGSGDLHDTNTNIEILKHVINFGLKDTQAGISVTYTLELYSSVAFYDEFHTNLPVLITIFAMVMILATAIFFSVYDRFMINDNLNKKMLLEGKRTFVRFVSHEIRSPLNAAMMGLQLMDERMMDQVHSNKMDNLTHEMIMGVHALSKEVRMNADVALVVLNDLLQYDKIEIGSMQLEIGVVNIWRMAKEKSAEMECTGIHLKVQGPFNDPSLSLGHRNMIEGLFVLGDNIRLAQAFRNLISNAIRNSTIDQTVNIKLEWVEHGLFGVEIPALPSIRSNKPVFRRGSIVLSVTDLGPGMTPQEAERVLLEGAQFQANKLQAGGGSGLSLFISKGIVELHGGVMSATSIGRNCGSTFTIELPLCSYNEGPRPPGVETFAINALSNAPKKVFPGGGVSKKNYSPLHLNVEEGNRVAKDNSPVDITDKAGEFSDRKSDIDSYLNSPNSSASSHLQQKDSTTITQGKRSYFSAVEAVNKFHLSSFQSSSRSSGSSRSNKSDNSDEMLQSSCLGHINSTPRLKNLLIVDNSFSFQKALGHLLERRGFVYDCAFNVEQCLKLLAKNANYDVILMAMKLPEVSKIF